MSDATMNVPAGCSWLTQEIMESVLFSPEQIEEDQKLILETALGFIEGEVTPKADAIEHMEPGVVDGLLRAAGELGLLSIDVPEEYGGLAESKVTSCLVNDVMSAAGGSFNVAFGGHVGIGTLPIVHFGTEEQKERYLPRLASGELLAAYALSEPGAGSDALSAKCTATLSPDGKHYILNGTKSWITNAGFADVFIVFSKIDGTDFTAFIVEKGTPGFSLGNEEKKMGIKGSSTRQLIFEDAPIPAENLLGKVGKGHRIAFGILNLGRLKLGFGCVGGSKNLIQASVKYANERKQFKKPISDFGLIRKKIAEQAIQTFGAESLCYHTAALFDAAIDGVDKNRADAREQEVKCLEEYAVESAIAKVLGSECLDFVVDEAVQIHGGYGFVEEYSVERPYRDSRVNRIFEGTNEINRMLIPGSLMKKAMKGELDLMTPFSTVAAELKAEGFGEVEPSGVLLDDLRTSIQMMKKGVIFAAGRAVQQHMMDLKDQQQLLGDLADLLSALYAMETSYARVRQAVAKTSAEVQKHALELLHALCQDGAEMIGNRGTRLLQSLCDGGKLQTLLGRFRKCLWVPYANPYALRQSIAQRLIEREKYYVVEA